MIFYFKFSCREASFSTFSDSSPEILKNLEILGIVGILEMLEILGILDNYNITKDGTRNSDYFICDKYDILFYIFSCREMNFSTYSDSDCRVGNDIFSKIPK